MRVSLVVRSGSRLIVNIRKRRTTLEHTHRPRVHLNVKFMEEESWVTKRLSPRAMRRISSARN